MDNKIILTGIIRFKKINNIRSNFFTLKYLSNDKKYKIKIIDCVSDEYSLENITNGMYILLKGQLLYNEREDVFLIKAEKIIPLKQRSGQAEETILIKNGCEFNNFVVENINTKIDDMYVYTHPKPIEGEPYYSGQIRLSSLKNLNIVVTNRINLF
jgi:hypothetical protein